MGDNGVGSSWAQLSTLERVQLSEQTVRLSVQASEEEVGLVFWNLSGGPHQLRHLEIVFCSEEGMRLSFVQGSISRVWRDSGYIFSK